MKYKIQFRNGVKGQWVNLSEGLSVTYYDSLQEAATVAVLRAIKNYNSEYEYRIIEISERVILKVERVAPNVSD